MKKDISSKIIDKMANQPVFADEASLNKEVKAVIINFGNSRGDIIVENDNFGTRRKYMSFENGKIKAGLHPLQIVWAGLESAQICHDRYVDKNGEVKQF